MFQRSVKLPLYNSFFLFGPRGTGKSSLLEKEIPNTKRLYIDLLLPSVEDRYLRNPEQLKDEVLALKSEIEFIVIDEIQKVPRLLDVVHYLIERTKKIFVLTGSSARKLKYGAANLLAGRAFTRSLYPLSFEELGNDFNLMDVIRWGSLPRMYHLESSDAKDEFLFAYTNTYLKEEILAEQIIRKADSFRKFLEVAAQSNTKILSFANISRDTGVDAKTVKFYFEILEDTLIGFFLEPFHHSVRKRLKKAPKFYFFDTGVTRALARYLPSVPVPSTAAFGELFEQLVINEFIRKDAYANKQFKFSYLRTENDVEIDLVIERPGKNRCFVEIKSGTEIRSDHLNSLKQFQKDFPKDEFYCLSNDPTSKKIEGILCLHWMEGIKTICS